MHVTTKFVARLLVQIDEQTCKTSLGCVL